MTGLELHPAVNWTRTPGGHLQLRLPTGNHITVDENVSEAARVLSDLRSKDRLCDANAAEPDAFEAEFIDILMRLNAVRVGPRGELRGTFQQFADYHAGVIASRLSRELELATGSITVLGDGNIASTIRAAIKKLELVASPEFRIVCADFEDVDLFMSENRRALSDEVPVTFLRWSREKMIVGPLVLTSNGPCYACYNRRITASAMHVDEMRAQFEGSNALAIDLDATFRSFVQFVASRHISFVAAGAFHLARAGHVERWDPFTLSVVDVAPLSRVPRCEHCGRSRAHDPVRAVRDLI